MDAEAAELAKTRTPLAPARPGTPAAAASPVAGKSTPVANSNSLPARPGSAAPAGVNNESNMQLAAPGQFAAGGAQAQAVAAHTQPTHEVIDYASMSREEAERAFHDMLRKHNVNPSWTWEQVLRDTVTEPAYRALRTLGERKTAFEQYCQDIRRRERENKERSMERNRPAWRTALGRLSEGDYGMKSWWSWERASREIKTQMPDVWSMSRSDEEREALWREYMGELSRKEEARAKESRNDNLDKLTNVLKSLELDYNTTRFTEAEHALRNSKEWREDTDLQAVEPMDFLILFEEMVKKAEQEAHSARAKQRTQRQREIRKNREAYIAYMQELKQQGKIKAGTKWKEIYPVVQNDERFTDMLSNPGSTPLELFWDVVDEMDQKIEEDTRVIENILSEKSFTVNGDTFFEQFDEQVREDARVSNGKIDEEARNLVHKAILDRIAFRAREEKRRAERKLRHQAEDFRYALRKLEPPLELSASYEDALPRFKDLPEFIELTDEETRKSSYEKFIKRQQERLEEKANERNGNVSDTESHTSRPAARGPSRALSAAAAAAVKDIEKDDRSSRRDASVAGSPLRSSTRDKPPTSPRSSRRRATSRDYDDRADYSNRRRDYDRERDRDGGGRRSERDADRGRDKAYDSDDDRRRSRKSSRRDGDYADRDDDRRGDRSTRREKERDRDGADRDREYRNGDEPRLSSSRKRDENGKEELRESKVGSVSSLNELY